MSETVQTTAMPTSRIGRMPVAIPAGVEVKQQDQLLTIKGAKGTQSLDIHPYVKVTLADKQLMVEAKDNKDMIITGPSKKLIRSIVGTTRARLFNLIHGVSAGFERRLNLVGVGYRAQAKGKVLALSLGFSHPIEYPVPAGVTIETPSQTEIVIKGVSKELIGLVAAQIRAIRGPEPYKGKGVRYANETIVLKEKKKK
jgi:large subunit ribosomal protein L6